MDELEHQAFVAAVSWLIQTNSSNALAVATTLCSDDDPIWPWKPYKRLGSIRARRSCSTISTVDWTSRIGSKGMVVKTKCGKYEAI